MSVREHAFVCGILLFAAIQAHASSECEELDRGVRLRDACRYEEAAEAFSRAIDSPSVECEGERASALAALAELRELDGERSAAIDLLRESLRLKPAERFDRRSQFLAALLRNEGHKEEAMTILEELARVPKEEDAYDSLERSAVLKNLARTRLGAGDEDGAGDAFREAVRIIESTGDYFSASDVRLEWAEHLEAGGRIDEARAVLQGVASNAEMDPRRASVRCLAGYLEFVRKHGPKESVPRAEHLLSRAKEVSVPLQIERYEIPAPDRID